MKSLPIRYYTRVQGQWSWTLNVELNGWRALFKRPISGAQMLLIALWQRVAGPLEFWTEVGQVSAQSVEHKTRVSKWGITLFKSSETIEFNQDHVTVGGKQASWPLLFLERDLGPFKGTITSHATAVYQFEMLGYRCECRSDLQAHTGWISFEGPAIQGKIELLDDCKRRLPGDGSPHTT